MLENKVELFHLDKGCRPKTHFVLWTGNESEYQLNIIEYQLNIIKYQLNIIEY